MKKKVELLAPAGDMKAFKAACNAGADAIYMGVGKYNARIMAENFTEEEYVEAIDYAHLRGVKVYLTLNTLIYQHEMKEALNLVLKLYSYGLDAVILQDIGLAMLIHKMLPNLALHASTQMSAYCLEQVQFLKKIGFCRVVLARELTLEEIQKICDNVDTEIEVFVHGALCVSLSGQCLLSGSIGNRSANRGKCAQPCRMKYSLLNETGKEILSNQYVLSKKDIFGLDMIEELIKAKITSLKIEGRNKSPEYVALVVSKYRKYIDKYEQKENIMLDEQDKKEITQIFNRSGISYGYLKGVKYKESITNISPKNTGLYLGTVLDQNKKYVKVRLEENIDLHDGIEIYSDDVIFSNIVTCIRNEKGNIINKEAKSGETIWIGDISKKIKYGARIYKTSSYQLNEKINQKYVISNLKKRKVSLEIRIKDNEKVNVIALFENNKKMVCISKVVPEIAKSRALLKEDVFKAFAKTLDTPFVLEIVKLELDEMLFLPISKLNEIRREVIEKLEKYFVVRKDISKVCMEDILRSEEKEQKQNRVKKALFVYQYDEKKNYLEEKIDRLDIAIQDLIKYEEDIFSKYGTKVKLGLFIPNLVFSNLNNYIKENLERLILKGFDTVICSSFSYVNKLLEIKKKKNITLIADYSFNIANLYSAKFLTHLGFDVIVPAFELTQEEIEEIAKYNHVEMVQENITVLTSRYCILGSFIANRDEKKCSMPCLKEKYRLKDLYGNEYHIVCDHTDCIMRLVKEMKRKELACHNIYSLRENII